jgi:DNA modification methylase
MELSPHSIEKLANNYDELASFFIIEAKSKKPKVKKFKDGIVINGEFGSPEVEELLKGEKLKLIIADPPYGSIVKNDWDQDIGTNDYIRWTEDCLKHLVKGGSLYIWGGIGAPGNRIFFEYLASVEKETGMQLRNLITWSKRRAYGKKDDYLFTREECAWLVNGDKPKTFHIPLLDVERGYAGYNPDYPAKSKYLRRTNVWTDINELFKGKVHIAQKPEKLAKIMIETHTNKGDTVMDPFAGSGSTGLAARTLGRKFILIERDPKNFRIICDRLEHNLHDKTASMNDDYEYEIEKAAFVITIITPNKLLPLIKNH